MSYDLAYETLMSIIPAKSVSLFKGLLSGYETLEVKVETDAEWFYWKDWDHLSFNPCESFKCPASDSTNKLSNNMYIYDDLVVFVENKGVNGWCHPKVTVLSLSKGFTHL